jgi:hypothetical protein
MFLAVVATLMAACLVALGLPLTAAAAPHAVSSFAYSHSFASEGQLSVTTGIGSTVVESGSGYVLVAGGDSVAVYKPNAAPGGSAIAEFAVGSFPKSITQDSASGAIYVLGGNGTVTRWTSDGAVVPSYTEDAGFRIEGLAANNIGVDPQTGDLLVLNSGTEQVVRYSNTGQVISTTNVGSAFNMAVAPDGSFYTAGYYESELVHFSATGVRLWEQSVEGIQGHGALAINPKTGNLDEIVETSYFGGEYVLTEYNSAGKTQSIAPLQFPGAGAEAVSGFAIGKSDGDLYLPVRSGNREIAVFGPAVYPGVESPKVESIGPNSIRLSAEVDEGEEAPGAGPPSGSFARFEYSSDKGQTWTPAPDLTVEATGTIEGEVLALDPNFAYEIRTTAGNEFLTHASASTAVTTPGIAPIVITGSASEVSATGASVRGTVETIGSQTGYFFEYGLSDSYGIRAPAGREGVAGNLRPPRFVTQQLTGLEPGTTYHFRLVATNAFGRTLGEDETFTTSRVEGEEAVRAYEQVTPIDKEGGIPDRLLGFLSSPDGSAVTYVSRPPGGPVSSNPWLARFAAFRSPEGWSVRGTDPLSGVPTGLGNRFEPRPRGHRPGAGARCRRRRSQPLR